MISYDVLQALTAALAPLTVHRRADGLVIALHDRPQLRLRVAATSLDLREVIERLQRSGYAASFEGACGRLLRYLEIESPDAPRAEAVALLGPYAAIEIARQSSPGVRYLLSEPRLSLGAAVRDFERGHELGSLLNSWSELGAFETTHRAVTTCDAYDYAVARALVGLCHGFGSHETVRLVHARAIGLAARRAAHLVQ